MKLLIVLLIIAAAGVAIFLLLHQRQHPSSINGIAVQDLPGDRPALERTYKADILGRTMKVTIKNYGWTSGLYKTGEITQWNGNWVLFDPDNVADKIIDRDLVPLVEQRCKEINQMDADFRSSNPSEFTDNAGTTWRRVQK